MFIDTVSGQEIIQKEVCVGCGVVIEVPGTRWRVTAEVIDILCEFNGGMLKVKGADFEGWIPRGQVRDVLSPGSFAFDNGVNVIGGEEE